MTFEPLHVKSLKETCVSRLEELILSGELAVGQRLPAERDLAARLGVSRPVLHEAFVDLASKGLVSILPRRGIVVNDYRKSGSTAILSSLLAYSQGKLDLPFEQSLFAMRLLVESETAFLAAMAAAPDDIQALETLLAAEGCVDRQDPQALTDLDFEFHLLVALASNNRVYPLIINSFRNVYTHYTREFFLKNRQGSVIDEVYGYHRWLVDAIKDRRQQDARQLMSSMLAHGERHLKGESQ